MDKYSNTGQFNKKWSIFDKIKCKCFSVTVTIQRAIQLISTVLHILLQYPEKIVYRYKTQPNFGWKQVFI